MDQNNRHGQNLKKEREGFRLAVFSEVFIREKGDEWSAFFHVLFRDDARM